MVFYELSHLTQDDSQRVIGPIQDDEALFLYALIKTMRLSRILEIGGLGGYSAQNFLASVKKLNGVVYTVDLNPVPVLAHNHKVIVKNALLLESQDVDSQPIDLVFFDCHDMVQMDMYNRFMKEGIITDKTVIALHDTNLHFPPYHFSGPYIKSEGGFAHQPVERAMVNMFKDMGYDALSLHTEQKHHDDSFPFRHGITVCQKFKQLR